MPNPNARHGRQRFKRGGYERRDADAGWIFGVVAFLVIAGLIMHFCLAGVVERLGKTPTPHDRWTGVRPGAGVSVESKAGPHLQLAPTEDLKKFREREDAELNTYGWIDRTAGVVRIPIERAMELVLQRGLPVRVGTNQDQAGPSSYELQQQRELDQRSQTNRQK